MSQALGPFGEEVVMANINGRITPPVGVEPDICGTLGVGRKSDGYYDSYSAISASTINKWSRTKPLRNSSYASLPRPFQHNSGEGTWGMEYPRVTGTNMLKNASMGVKAAGAASGYKNYTYLTVRTTDYGRLDDFDGYNQNAVQPVLAGMDGNKGSQITINGFASNSLRFYIQADANTEIGINEFWPETNLVYVVELYYKDSSSFSSDTPFLWAASTKKLSAMGKFDGQSIVITMSELKTAFKAKFPSVDIDNGEVKLIAIYGVMGLSSTGESHRAAASGDHFKAVNADFSGLGYLAPWNDRTHTEHQANITIANFFSYVFTGLQYTVTFPATTASFFDLTTVKTSYTADLGIKTSIKNTGTRNLAVHTRGTLANATYVRMMLRAHAVGDFRQTAGDPTYNTPYDGKTVEAGITSNGNVTTLTNLVTIGPNVTATVYLNIQGIIPVGVTKGIVIEASTDQGASWVIAQWLTAQITRN
nr:hypothetical protein [uncultured Muribaculum sp.]